MTSALMTVLIVDDDASLLEALTTALAPPLRVLTATTGRAACSILDRETVDLALIDYVLPDISGLALLRTVQKLCPELPIILITGFGSEDVAVEAFRCGVRDYIKKPFTISELVARFGRALSLATPGQGAQSADPPSADAAAPSSSGRNKNLERAIRFVDAHLSEEILLDRVAQEAGMSKYHFCRVFKRHLGVTFRKFVASRRIGRAVELLRDGGRSVSEVYLDVGFKNISHFGRVFRQLIGRPPSSYRRPHSTL